MLIQINGEQDDAAGRNLQEYLENRGYSLSSVVVEMNMEIIEREKLSEITIEDGDTIEVLKFMGGG